MRAKTLALVLSSLLPAATALGGPGAKGGVPAPARPKPGIHLPADGGPFTDNFDSYAAGSNLVPQNGWEIWYTGGSNAVIETTQVASAPNALRLIVLSDVVQRFTIADGKWEFSIKTYVPSSAPPGSGGSVIMMNQYAGPDHWSMQLAMNETSLGGSQLLPYMIESQWDGAVMPLVLDQWVEIRAEIDLDNDVWNSWYNGQPLGVNLSWSANSGSAGITSIANVDLWSAGIPEMYMDDVSLTQMGGCYPDCNNDLVLNLADFGCFQTAFAGGNTYADCNNDLVLNLADFGCFQTAFATGCP